MAIGAVGGVPAADYVPPVGIILTMGVSTSPAELYPGTTWARIKDRFCGAHRRRTIWARPAAAPPTP